MWGTGTPNDRDEVNRQEGCECDGCAFLFLYYEDLNREIKREIKGIQMCGCRCNERLKPKKDGSILLTVEYTGLYGELEHLKKETRLIDESFECVMGE